MLGKRLAAEAFGTFWLVLGGCGTAVLGSAGYPGVSLAFGLSVLTMAYAVGPISGCHLNPAVTLGLATAGRFAKKDVLAYWAAQVAGAVVAALVILVVAKGPHGLRRRPRHHGVQRLRRPLARQVLDGRGTDHRGRHDVHVRARHPRRHVEEGRAGLRGLAIGLCLTLVHLISINVTNTSVNPARSTGPALVSMRLGARAALALLGRPARRRRTRRRHVERDPRPGGHPRCSEARGRASDATTGVERPRPYEGGGFPVDTVRNFENA